MTEKAEKTRINILHTALQAFLDSGFTGASLRSIVKNAGLTTGAFYKYYPTKESLLDALLEPHLLYIYKIYDDVLENFENLSADEQTSCMADTAADGLEQMVDYVYDHYDNFRLLLKCGDSGRYEEFIHNMVEREIKSSLRYIEGMRSAGVEVPEVGKDLMHMIYTGFFSSVFQIIEHDYDRAVAKRNVHQLREFQTGGWERVWNVKFPAQSRF